MATAPRPHSDAILSIETYEPESGAQTLTNKLDRSKFNCFQRDRRRVRYCRNERAQIRFSRTHHFELRLEIPASGRGVLLFSSATSLRIISAIRDTRRANDSFHKSDTSASLILPTSLSTTIYYRRRPYTHKRKHTFARITSARVP